MLRQELSHLSQIVPFMCVCIREAYGGCVLGGMPVGMCLESGWVVWQWVKNGTCRVGVDASCLAQLVSIRYILCVREGRQTVSGFRCGFHTYT